MAVDHRYKPLARTSPFKEEPPLPYMSEAGGSAQSEHVPDPPDAWLSSPEPSAGASPADKMFFKAVDIYSQGDYARAVDAFDRTEKLMTNEYRREPYNFNMGKYEALDAATRAQLDVENQPGKHLSEELIARMAKQGMGVADLAPTNINLGNVYYLRASAHDALGNTDKAYADYSTYQSFTYSNDPALSHSDQINYSRDRMLQIEVGREFDKTKAAMDSGKPALAVETSTALLGKLTVAMQGFSTFPPEKQQALETYQARAHVARAEAYEKTGDDAKALADWRAAQRHYRHDPDMAAHIQHQIDGLGGQSPDDKKDDAHTIHKFRPSGP